MPPAAGFTGVVLCGGASRRMGRDKATLVVDGAAMALRVAEVLRTAGATDVRAVGGDAEALGALGLEVIADDRPGEGPLPATLTALRHARSPLVAVLSCDLIAPSATAVAGLVASLCAAGPEALGAVPVVDGHHQWTHAVWRIEARRALEESYASGARSLRRAAAALPLLEVHDLEPAHVADADTPADLRGPNGGTQRGRG